MTYEEYKLYNDLYNSGHKATALAILSGIFPGIQAIFNK